jgi:hypothetical protein
MNCPNQHCGSERKMKERVRETCEAELIFKEILLLSEYTIPANHLPFVQYTQDGYIYS